MAYVVIQFSDEDGGTLALVHKTWITPRKNEVYWPPHKNQTVFNKSLLKGDPVDCDHWNLYHIKRIFGAYDNFEEAQRKVKAAEYTSDLQSDVEEIVKKRQINKPLRYSNSGSSGSDEEVEVRSKRRLPRPPKITKRIISKEQSNCNFLEYKKSESHTESQQNLVTFSLNKTQASLLPHERLSSVATQEVLDTPTSSNRSPSTTPRADTPIDNGANSRLISYLSTVIEQNKEILAILRTRSLGFQHTAGQGPTNLPVKLPLESFDDLELFDSYLEEKQDEQLMSIFLSTLDRTSLVSSTTAILRHCISYKLAKELSFLGTRQNKKAFQKYNLKKLVINAVKRAIPSAVERNIEDQIKNWLKRAPKNYQLEQERQQKQNPADGL